VFWDGGHAIGSPSIADKVRTAGGDAVIILSDDEASHGGGFIATSGGANGGLGWLFGLGMLGGSKTITRMIVIKYLPDTRPSPSPAKAPTASFTPAPAPPPAPSSAPAPEPRNFEESHVLCITCRPWQSSSRAHRAYALSSPTTVAMDAPR
jgi:hypothetical protein